MFHLHIKGGEKFCHGLPRGMFATRVARGDFSFWVTCSTHLQNTTLLHPPPPPPCCSWLISHKIQFIKAVALDKPHARRLPRALSIKTARLKDFDDKSTNSSFPRLVSVTFSEWRAAAAAFERFSCVWTWAILIKRCVNLVLLRSAETGWRGWRWWTETQTEKIWMRNQTGVAFSGWRAGLARSEFVCFPVRADTIHWQLIPIPFTKLTYFASSAYSQGTAWHDANTTTLSAAVVPLQQDADTRTNNSSSFFLRKRSRFVLSVPTVKGPVCNI